MEATGSASVRGSGPDARAAALPREPLFWAAVAAFAGTAVGLAGTARLAALWDSYGVDPPAQLAAEVLGFSGDFLTLSACLGVAYLLWGALRRSARGLALLGLALLFLFLTAEAVAVAVSFHYNAGSEWDSVAAFPFPRLETASFWAIVILPPAVLLVFALVSFLAGERRLGLVVSALCLLAIPFGLLRLWLFPPDPQAYTEPTNDAIMFALGWYPLGMGLPETPFWVLLGSMLWRRARQRVEGEAFRAREKENLAAARRLYEHGLANGDASVVDELVSDDFRDVGRGSRGKLAMERVFSALWRTYPDLTVSIGSQEAEGDLVTTRLTLSGNDRGGVLWYPPTGRRATFTALFTDRFLDGKLVEHSGEADTQALLRQLGLTESEPGAPPSADRTKG